MAFGFSRELHQIFLLFIAAMKIEIFNYDEDEE